MSPKVRRQAMSKTVDTTTLQAERDQFLKLLQDAPPRQAIDDPRYWAWRRKVEAVLIDVKE